MAGLSVFCRFPPHIWDPYRSSRQAGKCPWRQINQRHVTLKTPTAARVRLASCPVSGLPLCNIGGSCISSRISGRNSHVPFSAKREGANWIIMRRTGALALLSALAHGTLAAADSLPRGVGPECKSLSSIADLAQSLLLLPPPQHQQQHARTHALGCAIFASSRRGRRSSREHVILTISTQLPSSTRASPPSPASAIPPLSSKHPS